LSRGHCAQLADICTSGAHPSDSHDLTLLLRYCLETGVARCTTGVLKRQRSPRHGFGVRKSVSDFAPELIAEKWRLKRLAVRGVCLSQTLLHECNMLKCFPVGDFGLGGGGIGLWVG
jgi:hypothetical protein